MPSIDNSLALINSVHMAVQASDATTPGTGYARVYVKNNGSGDARLHSVDSAGTVYEYGASTGAGSSESYITITDETSTLPNSSTLETELETPPDYGMASSPGTNVYAETIHGYRGSNVAANGVVLDVLRTRGSIVTPSAVVDADELFEISISANCTASAEQVAALRTVVNGSVGTTFAETKTSLEAYNADAAALTTYISVDAGGQVDVPYILRMSGEDDGTLASDALDFKRTRTTVNAETGTTDTIATLTNGTTGDVVLLRAASGDTITVDHEADNISLALGADADLLEDRSFIFVHDGSTFAELSSSLTEHLGALEVREDTLKGLTAGTDLFDSPACRVYNDANISIANASTTEVTFNTESFDNAEMHEGVTNPGRITIPKAGVYHAFAGVTFDNNANGVRRILLYKNGTLQISYENIESQAFGSGTEPSLMASAIYKLDVDDYLTVKVYQTSGGALNVQYYPDISPVFAVHYLGTGE